MHRLAVAHKALRTSRFENNRDAMTHSSGAQVWRMLCSFKPAADGRIYLSWCSCLDLQAVNAENGWPRT